MDVELPPPLAPNRVGSQWRFQEKTRYTRSDDISIHFQRCQKVGFEGGLACT